MDNKSELLSLLTQELERKGIKILQRDMGTQEIGKIDLLALQRGRLLLVSLFPHPDEALICQLLNSFDWARQNLHNLSLLTNEVDPSQPPGMVLVVSHLPSKIRTALSYLPLKDWQVYEYLLSDEGRMFLKQIEREAPSRSEVKGWRQEAILSSEELKELMDLHFGISQKFRYVKKNNL